LNIIFIHQNFPGQFRHLAAYLGGIAGVNVVSISQKHAPGLAGVRNCVYRPQRAITRGLHPYLASTEAYVLNGQAVARALLALREQGFAPDVVIAHAAWGEALYVKDIYPAVPVIGFFEFFYRARGADVDFDPEFPLGLDGQLRVRTRNATHLLSLDAVDVGVTPTEWQKSVFPREYHAKLRVIHEGIRTDLNSLGATVGQLELPSGEIIRAGDPVVTYVARNLEPYRGFHVFMRAVDLLLQQHERARVVIVGGDGVSYGNRLPGGGSYREKALREMSGNQDRITFLGQLPYQKYLQVLAVSTVHVYLTVPFVLSWSMLEAMSMGCLVLGSDTPPVREVIEHVRNGLLVDFFSPSAISTEIGRVLAAPESFETLRLEAVKTVQAKYSLTQGLAGYRQLLSEVLSRDI